MCLCSSCGCDCGSSCGCCCGCGWGYGCACGSGRGRCRGCGCGVVASTGLPLIVCCALLYGVAFGFSGPCQQVFNRFPGVLVSLGHARRRGRLLLRALYTWATGKRGRPRACAASVVTSVAKQCGQGWILGRGGGGIGTEKRKMQRRRRSMLATPRGWPSAQTESPAKASSGAVTKIGADPL